MSKICTGCDEKGIIKKSPAWVKKLARSDDPPAEYLPKVKDLISVDIKMGENFAGKYVYYFATESCDMLKKDKKNCNNVSPYEAYDNYENSGVTQLDDNGFSRIIISKPINYYVKEENNKTYKPHVHYRLSNKNGSWSKDIYTIQLN